MNANLLTKTLLGTAAASLAVLAATASPLFAQRPGEPPAQMTPEQMQQQHQEMMTQMEEMRTQMQQMREHCKSKMNGGGMGHGENSGMPGSGDSHDHQTHPNHAPTEGAVSPDRT